MQHHFGIERLSMNAGVDHSNPALQCYVQSIAVLGPGLPNWTVTQEILCGQQGYQKRELQIPPATCLPATERRRVDNRVRLALAVGQAATEAASINNANALTGANELASVFTSSSGDGDNCHALFTVLAHSESSERFLSPTRFHNSVHNAPAGYWSIASQCMLPSTSLCAYDASFAAGLLEACCQGKATGKKVLLVSSDVMYPQPLNGVRSMSSNFAVAMVLHTVATNTALAKLVLKCTTEPVSQMKTPTLEELRLSNPSARSLPLLQAIAKRANLGGKGLPEIVYVEYLDPLSLEILVE